MRHHRSAAPAAAATSLLALLALACLPALAHASRLRSTRILRRRPSAVPAEVAPAAPAAAATPDLRRASRPPPTVGHLAALGGGGGGNNNMVSGSGGNHPSSKSSAPGTRAAVAAPASRVAQATPAQARRPATRNSRSEQLASPAEERRRRLLAAGPDPDRDRGPRRDFPRRRPDPPAAPGRTPASPALRSPRRRANPMRKPGNRPMGMSVRAFAVASRWRVLTGGATAATAGAVPANFWGVVPQATPTPEQLPAAEAGRRRQHPRPVRLERSPAARRAARSTGPASTASSTPRRTPASRCCPFLTGAPSWAVAGRPPVPEPAEPAGQDRDAESGWTTFVREAVPRYGPTGSFWAENPDVPHAPDPHLADLERAELHVLRREAEPGRIRQAGQALLLGARRASTRARS